jgi:hypothetical protein
MASSNDKPLLEIDQLNIAFDTNPRADSAGAGCFLFDLSGADIGCRRRIGLREVGDGAFDFAVDSFAAGAGAGGGDSV